MSSIRKSYSKYTTVNINNPSAWGVCDLTGAVFNRTDLIKQKEWRGNSLVWIGTYRGKPFLDEPNQAGRIPIQKVDPKPVLDPRPPEGYDPTENPILSSQQMIIKLNNVNWNEGI